MASPPSPPTGTPRSSLALVLALATAVLALVIVLVLVLRSGGAGTAEGQPAASSGTHGEADDPGAPGRGDTRPGSGDVEEEITTYPEMEVLHGEARLDVSQAMYAEANRSSRVVAQVPEGATVALRAGHAGWSLVAWSAAGGQVWLGWVPVDLRDAAKRGADAPGTGRVEGVVRLDGEPPVMEVPRERQNAQFCKTRSLPLEDVVVKNGMLKDVLVRIKGGPIARRSYPPPAQRIVVSQVDCMYKPRVQGAIVGQQAEITNGDPTLHNVHVYLDRETFSNQAQPKGGEPIVKELDTAGILQLTCDVHPWMRAFIVVTENPFFAVTDEDGAFAIDRLPAGTYALEAWHPRFGEKRMKVTVGDAPASATFVYAATDKAQQPAHDVIDDMY